MSCKEPNDCQTEAQRFFMAVLDWVLSTAKRVAGRRGLIDYAHDIVQEAYLKCGKITNEKWSQKPNHKGYLARIIINLAKDLCNKYGNECELLADAIQASGPIEAADAADLIDMMTDNLSSGEEQLLNLVFQGDTGGEIAEKLGISNTAVRKRISRLREKLKSRIQETNASANSRAAGAKRPSLQAFE